VLPSGGSRSRHPSPPSLANPQNHGTAGGIQAPVQQRSGLRGLGIGWARLEDWLLAAWLVVISPLLAHGQGSVGPFESDRPLDGLLELVAVFGAIACLATTNSDRPAGSQPDLIERGAIGPLAGGLLLVFDSALEGLGWTDVAGLPIVAAIVMVIVLRLRAPALPTLWRRALVLPFVLVTGNLFWGVIDAVTNGGGLPVPVTSPDLRADALGIGLFGLFCGVYYVMLVYAPRQIAEREGGLMAWLLRFGLFLAGTVLGLGWAGILGS
jgi:hypothetical protein